MRLIPACVFLFLITGIASSCKTPTMIGTWKRIDHPNPESMKQPGDETGNMTLNADSTFFINGSPGADTSTIPGWNTGNMSGRWSFIAPGVMVKIFFPEENNLQLPTRIVHLTRNKLYLQIGGAQKNNGYVMKYKRID